MRNYFIFMPDTGGMVDSRELSIHIEHLPDIQRARERVEYITVPGRSGTLTKTEGDNIYDSYVKSFDIIALDEEKIPSINRLLRGNGKIIFSNEPQFRYTVSITDGWSFNRFFRKWRRATISMETQPFKESVEEKVYFCKATMNLADRKLFCRVKPNVKTDVPCPFFMECETPNMIGYLRIHFNGDTSFFAIVNSPKIYMDNEKGLFYDADGNNFLSSTVRGNFPMYFQNGMNEFTLLTDALDILNGGMTVKYRGWFL